MFSHAPKFVTSVTVITVTAILLLAVLRGLDGAGPTLVPAWLDVTVALAFVAAGLALSNAPAVDGNGTLLIAVGWLLLPRTLLGAEGAVTFTLAVLLEAAWLAPLVHFIVTAALPLRGRGIAIVAVVATYVHVAVVRVLYLMFQFRRDRPDIPENLLKVAGRHPNFDWVDPLAGYLPAFIGLLTFVALAQQFAAASLASRQRWLPVYVASFMVVIILVVAPHVADVGSAQQVETLLQIEQVALMFLALACLGVVAAELLAHRSLVYVASAAGSGGDLTSAIRTALRDQTATVDNPSLCPPGPGRHRHQLAVGGLEVGTLDVDERTQSDPMLRPVADFVAVALANHQLAEEVQAQLAEVRMSRERLVLATYAERRRMERDLHDGVQQILLAIGLELSLAASATNREDLAGASERIERARAHLQLATEELRRIVHGLVPSTLADLGLPAAIAQLAERSTIPVRTQTNLARRLPEVVETTAYYFVGEALTNAARHAAAATVRVNVDDRGGELCLTVRDDGQGGAQPQAGSGLVGLQDRVAAIGGTLEITSSRRGGTRIHATLPTGVG